MYTGHKLIPLTIIFVLLTACGKAEPTPKPVEPTDIPDPTLIAPETVGAPRTMLTHNEMLNGFEYTSPPWMKPPNYPGRCISPAPYL